MDAQVMMERPTARAPEEAAATAFGGLETREPLTEAQIEVVQLYVGARSSEVERAPKELKAFSKVELAPGETHTLHLAVPASDLAYYDEAHGWTVELGEYEVIVGRHSLDDQALRGQLVIR